MTDTRLDSKWFYRLLLIISTLSMAYVVFQPEYNFAHFIPHRLLRNIGISYEILLSFEQNADKLLHFIGGFLVTALLSLSKLPIISTPPIRVLIMVFAAIFFTEFYQWWIGRGFELTDLALGALGSYWAYRLIKR